MRNLKRWVITITAMSILGSVGIVYAATAQTPVEIISGLTGQTVEDLIEIRAEGKTYGTIADEAGRLEEFQGQILEQKKLILDQRVKEGRLSQEQADEIYESIQDRQAFCNGSGEGIGRQAGAGFGNGNGLGLGQGFGMRNGGGQGFGCGFR